jgi:two-component system, chemotaxis family, response regulator WspR
MTTTAVILLVDDQPIVAAALRKMLSTEADLALHYCQDPEQALAMAQKVNATVILQDLVMDGVSGFDMLERFRSNTATAAIPIIVLSSKEDPRDKSEAFSRGSNDYLVKIPDRIELIARLRAHSRAYNLQQERDNAFRALQAAREQLEAKNAILEKLSSIDGLTGIANRRRFDDTLKSEWQRARRSHSTVGLILIDVDFFKKYNDQYGHLQGDDCLRKVANALASVIKRPADLVARYGGEEFVVLLPDTQPEGVDFIAEQLRASVETISLPHAKSDVPPRLPLPTHNGSVVTISLGSTVVAPVDEQGYLQLIEAADRGLYAAKAAGRNRHNVIVADPVVI